MTNTPNNTDMGSIVTKNLYLSKICSATNGANNNLELKATNGGDESDNLTVTLSKNVDGTGLMNYSVPTSTHLEYSGIQKATALELQGGNNKAYNATIGRFKIDPDAALDPGQTTSAIMAGDIVQLYQNSLVEPTIEMYRQPASEITRTNPFLSNGIIDFENTNPQGFTFTEVGTGFAYNTGTDTPLTITKTSDGPEGPFLGNYIMIDTTSNTNVNGKNLLNMIRGKKVTVTVTAEVDSLDAAQNECFYIGVNDNTGVRKDLRTFVKTGNKEFTIDVTIPSDATQIKFTIGIAADIPNTGSVVKVRRWIIDIEPTKIAPIGVAQESGNPNDYINVCLKGITTVWAYTAGNPIPGSLIKKGSIGAPVEADTIAEGAGAADISGTSRAPDLGQGCSDAVSIQSAASREDVILIKLNL